MSLRIRVSECNLIDDVMRCNQMLERRLLFSINLDARSLCNQYNPMMKVYYNQDI
jgi:hypothetical protein